MKDIETIEQWTALADKLHTHGWQLWQMQHGTRSPEGFHAWFSKAGKKNFEVVTHSDAVYARVIHYK